MIFREKMNLVFVGHVDHGKSTVVGRMFADTHSLPQGKLEQIREKCKKESKTFEYAFLLDALKDEQNQGITIDVARAHFKTKKRDYIIIDAPGHIEFLKNMISGAARAEAAILVIDAKEGVRENSKRHGYLLSMLGIKQVIVAVNKMDLVDYDRKTYEKIKKEYTVFLSKIGVKPQAYIPCSALYGVNIASKSKKMKWHSGDTILSAIDSLKKEEPTHTKPFRMPVQDIYKFTSEGDERRIIAGKIESGTISVGDKVVFLPSNKRSEIASVEGYNIKKTDTAQAGYSAGFTLQQQIYVARGELMVKEEEKQPQISQLIKTHIFWMGTNPLVKNKEYKLKIGTKNTPVKVKEIHSILDASNLKNTKRDEVKRHEVAVCTLETQFDIAYDPYHDLQATGRFVIVDDFEISGGGIITEALEDEVGEIRAQVSIREKKWDHSNITLSQRALNYGQEPKLILLTGKTGVDKKTPAKKLEEKLFYSGRKVYFLGIGNILRGLDADIGKKRRDEHIRRLAEVAHILMDAGLIVIATASDLTKDELKKMQAIVSRQETLIVYIGDGKDINAGIIDLKIPSEDTADTQVAKIIDLLKYKKAIFSI
ncbi:MAG: adenylyl-sulfate kinase [Candidatus Altiarchaeota archaeon]|nr:adenylyl-sulfate kinase [Candidatus Altiarchaeota archaeon]